jgi:hypothetical protein
MKLIMENWRQYLKEDIENPTTWGELATKITMAKAAERWPRLGKTLLRLGFRTVTAKAKLAITAIEGLEDILDVIPDQIQAKLEAGAEDGARWLAEKAKTRGGTVGAFIVDDVMGMDDSMTNGLSGFEQLNIEDEYEAVVDKAKLKKWAKEIIRYAKTAPPDEKLPDLNQQLEDWFQKQSGAHPDIDEPDIRDAV